MYLNYFRPEIIKIVIRFLKDIGLYSTFLEYLKWDKKFIYNHKAYYKGMCYADDILNYMSFTDYLRKYKGISFLRVNPKCPKAIIEHGAYITIMFRFWAVCNSISKCYLNPGYRTSEGVNNFEYDKKNYMYCVW